ncbi:hypothetical protein TNCV_1826951 [Trichonephila clavipes]|nr:hypothetical protein TNCV_1826951 [Trichonephila clavipes]
MAKRNEIDSFLKQMVTGNEKWVTYDNIVRKRSRSKCGEVAQQTRTNGQSLLSTIGPFEASDRPEMANREEV